MKTTVVVGLLSLAYVNAKLSDVSIREKLDENYFDQTTFDEITYIDNHYNHYNHDNHANHSRNLQEYPCTNDDECGFGRCLPYNENKTECVCISRYVSNDAACNREKIGFVTPMVSTVFFGCFGAWRLQMCCWIVFLNRIPARNHFVCNMPS